MKTFEAGHVTRAIRKRFTKDLQNRYIKIKVLYVANKLMPLKKKGKIFALQRAKILNVKKRSFKNEKNSPRKVISKHLKIWAKKNAKKIMNDKSFCVMSLRLGNINEYQNI